MTEAFECIEASEDAETKDTFDKFEGLYRASTSVPYGPSPSLEAPPSWPEEAAVS